MYLPRTEGVSSTEIRSKSRNLRLGVVGEVPFIKKYIRESEFVNGCRVSGACSADGEFLRSLDVELKTDDYDKLLDCSDAVYVASHPSLHYKQIKKAIEKGKHVLCESPSRCPKPIAPSCLLSQSKRALFLPTQSKPLILLRIRAAAACKKRRDRKAGRRGRNLHFAYRNRFRPRLFP